MEDEVTRLPSFPREDPSSPESSPSVTLPPIEKVGDNWEFPKGFAEIWDSKSSEVMGYPRFGLSSKPMNKGEDVPAIRASPAKGDKDLEGMGLDHDLLDEEDQKGEQGEVKKEKEKKKKDEATNPFSP
ncbi:Cadherin EGF LAG seven-pass G-type receptor 3 like [Actinidia chinensis var. chinensis]|uniref:Cadherin EGF LAG seven-pass G-type receptor 3 like n=1 Tax=Actinidia chinensis var. chinensis TaxID=1590841 RepID=A0A2R6QHL3_ACTCC|nr:Cadherin EGF LAG seven-pass G-type receptor 3 like [Actinidia chinensis var. chinensis]